jgi:predicted RNA binding protein YcfA (HicA-like mRNA interferase family)
MVRILERAGFVITRTRGSHFIMAKGPTILTVPCHGTKTLPRGTQRGILRDAGLSVERFESLRLS